MSSEGKPRGTDMGTKEKVLKILQEHSGEYLSGQEIADGIFVTRACIWKSIKALKEDGYEIDAVTNKGYRLRSNVDAVSEDYICSILEDNNIEVYVYDEVTSTNDVVIEKARESKKCTLVIADSQTKGRGRRGRDFYSPKMTGLYMSIAMPIEVPISEMSDVTARAASATAKAIDDLIFDGEDATTIKWVNDIYYNEKKVAGILSEAHTSLEDEESYIVIGFGINVYKPVDDFPKEIKQIAGAIVSGERADNKVRSKLAVRIVEYLLQYMDDDEASIKLYRDKSMLIGSYVKVDTYKKNSRYAYVTGIDDEYHLCVKYDDGQEAKLSSGEVSVIKY